jgi:hypothetical protein
MPETPHIGQSVEFFTKDESRHSNGNKEGPYAAIVTRVWSPTCVNLKVLPDCGEIYDSTSVSLDASDDGSGGGYSRWRFPLHR